MIRNLPSPLPDSLLRVEDRPAGGEQDGDRDDREKRREDQEGECGDGDIGQSLGGARSVDPGDGAQ